MKKAVTVLALLLVVGAAFLTGAWFSQRSTPSGTAAGRKILYWHDPMHPAYRSDKPGIAPDCGMQLEPVYADGAPASAGTAPRAAGTVDISPEKQQLIGVRLGEVDTRAGTHTLRLLGRVAPDETRVHAINAPLEGSIREVAPVTTGSRVRKGQVLASYFSNESRTVASTLVGSLDMFTRALQGESSTVDGRGLPQLDRKSLELQRGVLTERLKGVGFSDDQIEGMARTREIPLAVQLVSPVDGFVLARTIYVGQKFDRGTEWFRIADLRRVWILADVFEQEAEHLRPGMSVQVSLPGQGKTLPARVSEVLPQFDPSSRTMKVRLEADNPGFVLRPEMFVDVEVAVELPALVSVPVDAVVDSGRTKTVFVESGSGVFEPRIVETGRRFGDRVEIREGLEPGERIVVAGTFLVDSESRMKAAAAGIHSTPRKDPVCGMSVDEAKARAAGKVAEHEGRTHFFCSKQCKHSFQADPGRFLGQPSPTPAAQHHEHTAASGAEK